MCVCVSDLTGPAMPRSGWSKRSKSGASPGPCEAPQGPGIHVYLFWSKEGERYLSHTGGGVTAEELCISAAEAVGEGDHAQTRVWSEICLLGAGRVCNICVCFPRDNSFVPCVVCSVQSTLALLVQPEPRVQSRRLQPRSALLFEVSLCL